MYGMKEGEITLAWYYDPVENRGSNLPMLGRLPRPDGFAMISSYPSNWSLVIVAARNILFLRHDFLSKLFDQGYEVSESQVLVSERNRRKSRVSDSVITTSIKSSGREFR